MNGERGAGAEGLGKAKVIVGEAGIGTLLVEGRNDADPLLVKDERDQERRQAAGSAGSSLIDLGIFQKRIDALALPARQDPRALRSRGNRVADEVGDTIAVGGDNAKASRWGGDPDERPPGVDQL